MRALAGAGRRVVRQVWQWPLIELLLIAAAAAVVLVVLLGPLSLWAAPTGGLRGKDRADVINATRQTLLAAGGGLALLIGAAFTARTFHLSRRGQLADRYARAVALLASERLTERLGGIYSLEHLLRESVSMHPTIVEVLAAFVRESSPRHGAGDPATPGAGAPSRRARRPATDVQAALTALGRRPDRREPNPVDLSFTDLAGASLAGARLPGADFTGADLTGARLDGAVLAGARFPGATGLSADQLARATADATTEPPDDLRTATA